MAVYTDVPDDDLERFVGDYDLGEVLSFKGIAEGIENSNYLLRTARGAFILTLYEKRVAAADLPFFLGLMDHLAARGIACPTPVKGRDGAALRSLRGRPAAIVTFLDGLSVKKPRAEHCLALGRGLAALHEGARDFPGCRANALGLAGFRPLFQSCAAEADSVSPGLAQEIASELEALEAAWPRGLPEGVIHADLFPDNVFFMHETLSGLIDFYFACNDHLAYDLAICLNAWCFEEDGQFNITKARALLDGYRRQRPLSDDELAALPVLARGAALRFLLTRLYDWLKPADGALVKRKNPLEFLAKLRFHRRVTGPAAYGLS
jgi:homoserine kinase type II